MRMSYPGALRYFRSTIQLKSVFIVSCSTLPVKSRWTHLVGVWDKEHGKASLYVDGLLAAQSDCSGSLKAPASDHRCCFLGCDLRGSDGTAEAAFRGQIATLRLYRAPLSAQDVARLFERTTNLPILQTTEAQGESLQGIYNLLGQRVENPRHGIFIRNGKKFLMK